MEAHERLRAGLLAHSSSDAACVHMADGPSLDYRTVFARVCRASLKLLISSLQINDQSAAGHAAARWAAAAPGWTAAGGCVPGQRHSICGHLAGRHPRRVGHMCLHAACSELVRRPAARCRAVLLPLDVRSSSEHLLAVLKRAQPAILLWASEADGGERRVSASASCSLAWSQASKLFHAGSGCPVLPGEVSGSASLLQMKQDGSVLAPSPAPVPAGTLPAQARWVHHQSTKQLMQAHLHTRGSWHRPATCWPPQARPRRPSWSLALQQARAVALHAAACQCRSSSFETEQQCRSAEPLPVDG